MKSFTITLTALLAFSFGIGCINKKNSDKALTESTALLSLASNVERPLNYEEFKATAYRETIQGKETGVFIVNGDVPASNETRLHEFYEDYLKSYKQAHSEKYQDTSYNKKSAVYNIGGSDIVWNSTQKKNLTYCVSNGFGNRKSIVIQAMADSMGAWEQSANIDFVYVSAQDANCNASNNNVLFDVSPVSGQGYLARAFFPNTGRSERNVLIDDSSFSVSPPITMVGILRHELGHTLGLRHEQTRPEAGKCFEDNQWRGLTAYDRDSVMHYPQCNGNPSSTLSLTALDKQGIVLLYGAPGGNPTPDPTPTPSSDTTVPTVSVTAPQSGATVNSIVTISASASDNVGVTKVEFFVDDSLKGSSSTTPYGYSWNSANIANGTHSITAKAYDAAGNAGVSARVTVTVQNSTGTGTCKSSNDTNAGHVQNGRAYLDTYQINVYAKGSNQYIGFYSPFFSSTLYSSDNQNWYLSQCPAAPVSGAQIAKFDSDYVNDGYVRAECGTNAASDAVQTVAPDIAIGRSSTGKCLRGILSFNTSSIPVTATITKAYLKLTLVTQNGDPWSDSANNRLVMDVNSGTFGSLGPQGDDFASPATQTWTAGSNEISEVLKWTSGQKDSTLFNANGLSTIARGVGGRTEVRLRFLNDPTNSSTYLQIRNGMLTGNTQLIIEYTN